MDDKHLTTLKEMRDAAKRRADYYDTVHYRKEETRAEEERDALDAAIKAMELLERAEGIDMLIDLWHRCTVGNPSRTNNGNGAT